MKNLILLLSSFVLAMTLNAQKVALHSSSGIHIFNGSNGFVDAYNAASAGDTIYLSGGGFMTTPIDKQLCIFGAGHYVDSTRATGKTIMNGNFCLTDSADGAYIEGIDITGDFEFTTSLGNSIDNVTLAYSKVSGNLSLNDNGATSSTNFALLRSVVVGSANFSNSINAAALSSIIQGRIDDSEGILYENNILFYSYGSTTYATINGDNNTIKNNIFFCKSSNYSGVKGAANQLYNNLFTSSSPQFGGSSTAEDNYYTIPEADVFVNHLTYIFDYDSDFHLQTPATYFGTDNSPVGIYGGSFPYKEGAVPSNPHIQLKNVSSTSDADGNLQIEFKIRAQDE